MDEEEFEQVVALHYEGLYAFGLSLSHNRDDACELAQETFCKLATKGKQIRDKCKLKSWLFTTLYRNFLAWKRREKRLPHFEISSVDHELPGVSPRVVESTDANTVLEMLAQIEERYRLPLMLFYLDNHAYKEIAEILDIPSGTVMSRLSRGKAILRRMLTQHASGTKSATIVNLNPARPESSNSTQ